MHARYLVALTIFTLPLSLLVPACADPAPEVAEEVDVAPDELRDGPRDIEPERRIVCGGGGPEACVKQCHYAGVACFTRVEHPYRPEVGIGDLYACRVTAPKSCEFKYPGGETCRFFKNPNTVLCIP